MELIIIKRIKAILIRSLYNTSELRRLKAENAELMRLVIYQESQIKMLRYIIRNDL